MAIDPIIKSRKHLFVPSENLHRVYALRPVAALQGVLIPQPLYRATNVAVHLPFLPIPKDHSIAYLPYRHLHCGYLNIYLGSTPPTNIQSSQNDRKFHNSSNNCLCDFWGGKGRWRVTDRIG